MLEFLDWHVGRKPWRLFEIADLPFIPPVLRESAQAMLTARWTHKLPLIQAQAPAELVAHIITDAIETVEAQSSDTELTVIDFCSGSGGPIPLIEKTINARRRKRGLKPMPFMLSDLHPNLDDWMELSQHSANLSFFPNPVDATNPPVAVTNHDAKANMDFASYTRVFRLYCLSFHHFDDAQAVKTLKSAMETSDGFAIIELQDRRISSVVLMFLEFFLLFIVTFVWFPRRRVHLIFTYLVPVMPFLQAWDGTVSALRTRKFDEVLALVDTALGKRTSKEAMVRLESKAGACQPSMFADRGDWVFEGGVGTHTWPIGRVNWFIGHRKAS